MSRAPRLGVDFPVTLGVAALALGATAWALAGGPGGSAARWFAADRDRVISGEIWRLLTGPFLHVTWGHVLRDLALVVLPGAAYEALLGRSWRVLVAAGIAAPAAAALAAGFSIYYGLSGLSHALLAAALGCEVRRRRGWARFSVAALLAAGAIKVGYELASGAPAFPMDLGPGVRQVAIAHAAGAALGLVAGLAARPAEIGSEPTPAATS